MRLGRRVQALVGVFLLVGSCSRTETGGDPSTEPPEPSTTSSTVFTWEDDPSEWVTAGKRKAMFQHLSKRCAGVDLDETEVTIEGSTGIGEERAWSGAEMRDPDWAWTYDPGDHNLWVAGLGRFQMPPGVPDAVTDPRLPEGVVITRLWAWGPELKGPNSDEWFTIDLHTPDALPKPDPDDIYPDREGPYSDMYFEFVSWMLRELGWAD